MGEQLKYIKLVAKIPAFIKRRIAKSMLVAMWELETLQILLTKQQ